ncbi:exocyst complex component Sec3-domain-containing protein [Phanerochaete sordida]|uniref:Exocyst complex component Sec3-domain-containing protein n=1 Tax=Phanerochaete sordida TaxID=48140 RepID=A0A9P3LEV5_9APHY|nr:exocyst complex component Sec3-domain-containing protein [Phanerochaete sordida]
MTNAGDVAQRIISTALVKLSAAGSGQHTYVSHLKVLEENPQRNGGGLKTRYLVLAESDSGDALIHKAKKNSDGTFSVGKTWPLSFLRRIEVVEPVGVSLTLRRTYSWQAEDAGERDSFVAALIRHFRLANPGSPLHIVGVRDLGTLAPEPSAPPPYAQFPHATTLPRMCRPATSTKPEQKDGHAQQTLPLPITSCAPARARRRRQLRAFLAGMLACLVLLQIPYLLLPGSAPRDAGPLVPHGVRAGTSRAPARTSASAGQYVPEGYYGGVPPPRSLGVLG